MTSIDFLAQKIIKYSNVDRENSQINLSVPFLLWEEWYEQAKDMSEKPTDHKDKIVQQVIDKFNQRSELGIKKYGTTLEENNNDDYFTHLQEELMDAILYIQKLKSIKYANR
jgi:hypothetical protein